MNDIIELLREFSRDLHILKEDIKKYKQRLYEQMSEEWLDSRQVMDILKISKRNLQYMRSQGDLWYNRVKGKCYYRASEVRGMLEGRGRDER